MPDLAKPCCPYVPGNDIRAQDSAGITVTFHNPQGLDSDVFLALVKAYIHVMEAVEVAARGLVSE
jgi:hypothetical protein